MAQASCLWIIVLGAKMKRGAYQVCPPLSVATMRYLTLYGIIHAFES